MTPTAVASATIRLIISPPYCVTKNSVRTLLSAPLLICSRLVWTPMWTSGMIVVNDAGRALDLVGCSTNIFSTFSWITVGIHLPHSRALYVTHHSSPNTIAITAMIIPRIINAQFHVNKPISNVMVAHQKRICPVLFIRPPPRWLNQQPTPRYRLSAE